MQCFFCPNPAAHPSTGSELSANVLACEACTRSFWKWFRGHMHAWSRPGRPDFYAAAALTPPMVGSAPSKRRI
jgi:hypothetical protein